MKRKLKRITHFVVKIDDVTNNSDETKKALEELSFVSRLNRTIQLKDPEPQYIVINTDEPYIDEIINVMKKHGHWDGWEGDIEE